MGGLLTVFSFAVKMNEKSDFLKNYYYYFLVGALLIAVPFNPFFFWPAVGEREKRGY